MLRLYSTPLFPNVAFKVESVFLEVRESNQRALAFFMTHGIRAIRPPPTLLPKSRRNRCTMFLRIAN